MRLKDMEKEIFSIKTKSDFEVMALKIFQFQYENNAIYRNFVDFMKIDSSSIKSISQIPFLPIELFKNHKIVSGDFCEEALFLSSGTGSMSRSKHYVKSLQLYENSFMKSFEIFFGNVDEYSVFALLPSYIEQGNSSLVYMVEKIIEKSRKGVGGFYLHDFEKLSSDLKEVKSKGLKVFLIGVTYALLDFSEKFAMDLSDAIIVETGGMKGRKEEMLKSELHSILKTKFGVSKIYSEYGMAELLSQAWSEGEGVFRNPPWMKILVREETDPLNVSETQGRGGINIIDLANLYSCSFIETQDLGKLHSDGSFEILGRFSGSDVRGCSLLAL